MNEKKWKEKGRTDGELRKVERLWAQLKGRAELERRGTGREARD